MDNRNGWDASVCQEKALPRKVPSLRRPGTLPPADQLEGRYSADLSTAGSPQNPIAHWAYEKSRGPPTDASGGDVHSDAGA